MHSDFAFSSRGKATDNKSTDKLGALKKMTIEEFIGKWGVNTVPRMLVDSVCDTNYFHGMAKEIASDLRSALAYYDAQWVEDQRK